MVRPHRAGPCVARWSDDLELKAACKNCRDAILLPVRVHQVLRDGVVERVNLDDLDAHVRKDLGPEEKEGSGQGSPPVGAAEAIEDLDVHGKRSRCHSKVQGLQVGHDFRWQVLDASPGVPDQTVSTTCEWGRVVPLVCSIKEPHLALVAQVWHSLH